MTNFEKFYASIHSVRGLKDGLKDIGVQCGLQSYQASKMPTINDGIWNETFEFDISSYFDIDISIFVSYPKLSTEERFIGFVKAPVPTLNGYDYSAKWYSVSKPKLWISKENMFNDSGASYYAELFISISLDPKIDFFTLSLDSKYDSFRNVARKVHANPKKTSIPSLRKKLNMDPTSLLARDGWVDSLVPSENLIGIWNDAELEKYVSASQLLWVLDSMWKRRCTNSFYKWKFFSSLKENSASSEFGAINLDATVAVSTDNHDDIKALLTQKLRAREVLDEEISQLQRLLLETQAIDSDSVPIHQSVDEESEYDLNFPTATMNTCVTHDMKSVSTKKAEVQSSQRPVAMSVDRTVTTGHEFFQYETPPNFHNRFIGSTADCLWSSSASRPVLRRGSSLRHDHTSGGRMCMDTNDIFTRVSSANIWPPVIHSASIGASANMSRRDIRLSGRLKPLSRSTSAADGCLTPPPGEYDHLTVGSQLLSLRESSAVSRSKSQPSLQLTPSPADVSSANKRSYHDVDNHDGPLEDRSGVHYVSTSARRRKGSHIPQPPAVAITRTPKLQHQNDITHSSAVVTPVSMKTLDQQDSPKKYSPLLRAYKLLEQMSKLEDDHDSNVRVAIRMRPLNEREEQHHARIAVSMQGTEVIVKDLGKRPSQAGLTPGDKALEENKCFTFDYCFDAHVTDANNPVAGNQQTVFERLGLEVLSNTWRGYNSSLFAYGQTGSGKSYSMMGSREGPDKGIIPRICEMLFYLIENHSQEKYTVDASYLEIYNENIRDLLNPKQSNLKMREHPVTGVFVENLSSCAVLSYEDIEDLLAMGLHQRTTAATNMNQSSSRSHSVFTITIRSEQIDPVTERKKSRCCKLCLVDLAGSERAQSTGATGARLREGANINKSLSTLGRCISALAKAASESKKDKKSGGTGASRVVIPYRDSVLTTIMRETLCGNAKTAMLATISPADDSITETMSTLRYAHSAKHIVTKAVLVEEDPTSKVISGLREEVQHLRELLEAATASESLNVKHGRSLRRGSAVLEDDLHRAEAALKVTDNIWSSKLETLRTVKNQLRKQHVASLGDHELDVATQAETPYLLSLSNDPLLHLAVKVHLPKQSTMHIGRIPRPAEVLETHIEPDPEPDLQLEGIGIEVNHCSVHHDADGRVLLRIPAGSVTYVNGRRRDPSYESSSTNNHLHSIVRLSSSPSAESSSLAAYSEENEDKVSLSSSFTNTPGTTSGGSRDVVITLQSGDRIVLGACSHIFAVIIPTGQIPVQVKPPTYQMAVREVVVGREETEDERQQRLVRKIVNILQAPFHRRIFEDSLIEALTAVREANAILSRLSPTSGCSFETSLFTNVDENVLSSLTLRDLFTFKKIYIRVRLMRQRGFQSDEMIHTDSKLSDNFARKLFSPSRGPQDLCVPDSPQAMAASDEFGSSDPVLEADYDNSGRDVSRQSADSLGESTLDQFKECLMDLGALFQTTLPLRTHVDHGWDKLRGSSSRQLGSWTELEPAELAEEVVLLVSRTLSADGNTYLAAELSSLLESIDRVPVASTDSQSSNVPSDNCKRGSTARKQSSSSSSSTSSSISNPENDTYPEVYRGIVTSIGRAISHIGLNDNAFTAKFASLYKSAKYNGGTDGLETDADLSKMEVYKLLLLSVDFAFNDAILRCFARS